MKKAQSLSLNTIVIAVMVILVLVIISFIVIRNTGKANKEMNSCSSVGGFCSTAIGCQSTSGEIVDTNNIPREGQFIPKTGFSCEHGTCCLQVG